ncbi:hypothetical protein BDZ85DRAFT_59588 [Elsinoe ampelina]|uniref:Uncharacterized protein n=1 Tax=Elsinoe ampelina TaxID=302913 RepID=A0A6A6G0E6_9PEZI|nr:hypothetical protein BDZ85DRAFT_59588 [Elsinoe ampelina]
MDGQWLLLGRRVRGKIVVVILSKLRYSIISHASHNSAAAQLISRGSITGRIASYFSIGDEVETVCCLTSVVRQYVNHARAQSLGRILFPGHLVVDLLEDQNPYQKLPVLLARRLGSTTRGMEHLLGTLEMHQWMTEILTDSFQRCDTSHLAVSYGTWHLSPGLIHMS